ncbi:ABC-type Fe3+-hydroxamate transport system substrate-binding protein [Oxalobacteraceae bacterium GrIS 2.11]
MSTRQDALGKWHAAFTGTPRIVSLVPSITELVCDLGLSACLVGRTGFCIRPQDLVQAIPKVGGTKDVNLEKIRSLAPTHLIVNIDENEKPGVEQLAEFIPHVIVTHPQTLDDNLNLFDLLGTVFNATEPAQRLTQDFRQAKAQLQDRLPTVPQRVLYCIWKDPWMAVSDQTYIADMLAQIGWQVAHSGATRYPVFTWDDQLARDIDLVLLSSEPYRFTEKHADALEQQCGKPVLLVDGEMLSWYGSRSIAGMRYLKKLALGEVG